MVLIGLMGNAGSGKTEGAKYLVDKWDFIEKSFADPLKKACQEMFLFTDEQVYGTQEQKETPDPRWFDCTPRKALQFVGTELFRDNLDKIMPGLDKNIFTHHFKLWYEQQLIINPNIRVVVSDVRFQNEADFIRNLGGVVIKLERQLGEKTDTHSSEVELRNIKTFDYLIKNTGTIKEYQENICKIVSNLLDNAFNCKYMDAYNQSVNIMSDMAMNI
ncbi:ankyrin repeat protein [Megavirus baoshan]|uniref:Putative deoxynucleotide monophosphate kinase n=1 Tax=Megavirus baoshan TaxID=2496520 RepID=A0A3Q8U7P0_9VIRU|nr:ankyrin repeat protein [Megavirus baoshan]AZL89235.1 ankyrin repeat protein [Megavirus baoshan]